MDISLTGFSGWPQNSVPSSKLSFGFIGNSPHPIGAVSKVPTLCSPTEFSLFLLFNPLPIAPRPIPLTIGFILFCSPPTTPGSPCMGVGGRREGLELLLPESCARVGLVSVTPETVPTRSQGISSVALYRRMKISP